MICLMIVKKIFCFVLDYEDLKPFVQSMIWWKIAIPENVNWEPSSFQQLVLRLRWFKLSLAIQDLAYRCDVSKLAVSLTFLK